MIDYFNCTFVLLPIEILVYNSGKDFIRRNDVKERHAGTEFTAVNASEYFNSIIGRKMKYCF